MCGLCACGKLIYYVILAAVFIYLVLCVILIPQYRFVAILVFVLVILYTFSAWRLLPSERFLVRESAEAIAKQRCAPPSTRIVFSSPAVGGICLPGTLGAAAYVPYGVTYGA